MVTYELRTKSSAGGSVTLPGEGVFTYSYGTVVDLLATPGEQYRFLNWSGDTGQIADVHSSQTVITMAGDYDITANFELDADPDLVITDVWDENGTICYQVRNIGEAVAPKGHQARLYIDNEPAVADLIDSDLMPGERKSSCFSQYIWSCTSLTDDIRVCADGYDQITESDETNNCRSESWSCDTIPPVITSVPVVSKVGPHSVDISWATDTMSDSVVMFGATAGIFTRQAEILKPTQTHQIHLEDLLPSTTYHFRVMSTDASGNTGASRDFFFQTAPAPDSTAPVISELKIQKGEGDLLYYMMTARVDDNTGVERVEFYLDDKLVCIDYSEPFECQLAPMDMAMSREEFFSEHIVEVVALDHAGMVAGFGSLFNPPYECDEIRMEMEQPYRDETFYIDTTSVPPGTSTLIRVRASMPVTDCAGAHLPRLPPGAYRYFCENVEYPVSEVRFYVNGELIGTEFPSTPLDYVFDVVWDIGGKSLGNYFIRVDAIGNEACQQTVSNTFRIEIGEPRLDVVREVTRVGNYFRIDLLIRNRGTGTATFDILEDSVAGFQPIAKSSTDYDVISRCTTDGKQCGVEIDFAGNHYDIEPHGSRRISYFAVPIMYPPAEAADYSIGANPVRIVDFLGIDPQEFDRPCVMTEDEHTLSSEVDRALRSSDYLIVTNPDRLFATSADVAGINSLLSTMAELARYRNGIIGYLYGPDSIDPGWVRDCIRTWGTPMRGMDGVSERYLSNGYLLLVGEIEIIPSFTITVEETRWLIHTIRFHIHWTDMPYGDMNAHIDPELSVGRIIGDYPAELILPLETSVNVVKGEPGFEFDRSHAFVVSGAGDGVGSFERNVDAVAEILDDEFSVTIRKRRVVEGAGGNINTEFKLHDGNQDHFFYRDHCSPTAWSGVIGTVDFGGPDPIDFEDAKPFAFACCCQAGRYEGAADNANIAESFLQHGTASYIGSTENSYRGQNNSAAGWFYRHWVNTPLPVGEVFRVLKVNLAGFQGDVWSYEYNLYGDPKYGGAEPLAPALAPEDISLPPSPYIVQVPDYVVKSLTGEDHVQIPEGNMLLVENKPAVPYYRVRIEYPAGHAVQDVTLTERSGLETATGLNIPLSQMGLDDADRKSDVVPGGTEEWWPPLEVEFDYHFETRPDGTSLLTITLFPFYYNSLTMDVKFYKDYTFDIQSAASGLGIAIFTTGKDNYAQGEIVDVDLRLKSTEAPHDVIVEVVVKEESSGEVVDGLLLRTLSGMTETSIFSVEWDNSNFPPGTYYLEANIRDSAGDLLDSRRRTINLGLSSIEIESFTATPNDPEINTSFVFRNSGSVELSGTAVIKVQNEQGHNVREIHHDFTDLPASTILTFPDSWDASGAAKGVYRIQAYVLYESRSSEIRSLSIPLCLDLSDFAKVYGSVIGENFYDFYFDFDRDGDVDGRELAVLRTYNDFIDCP
jgi:hypothetical protein